MKIVIMYFQGNYLRWVSCSVQNLKFAPHCRWVVVAVYFLKKLVPAIPFSGTLYSTGLSMSETKCFKSSGELVPRKFSKAAFWVVKSAYIVSFFFRTDQIEKFITVFFHMSFLSNHPPPTSKIQVQSKDG